ncbi:uncharacterized protein MONOS_6609 [Monocercomonoides exilis]|uniref:uncharacterized protein n=1 Tax=Monocercomonoides exilis TaxID=2049356 RepID=UPI00355978AE|nr:hypothetical protein MONOS_6609 [Monocercomonoides exilis]|eukprot:MONOS_6609.1-p1 / transcript=MONOS_6609.1 / gene=MONOS_6609 / organism=Monocercomonoides_exilis_PA203 / gene_product=unspecified product / transcript_product=unspecified product / location=Mono_scaffold00211:24402-24611(+) / protein_length=70 / sequence_SO=supercontig / SO=protein_coding / is_pseudo=false
MKEHSGAFPGLGNEEYTKVRAVAVVEGGGEIQDGEAVVGELKVAFEHASTELAEKNDSKDKAHHDEGDF